MKIKILDGNLVSAYALYNNAALIGIDIVEKSTNRTIVNIYVDVVDQLTYCYVKNQVVAHEIQTEAINYLGELIIRYVGGACFINLPNELAPLLEKHGFFIEPTDKNNKLFKNVIFIHNDEQLAFKLNKHTARFVRLMDCYEIVTDKHALLPRSKEISKLLISNAANWIGNDNDLRIYYSPKAIEYLITPEQVQVFAIKDMRTDKLIAFMRAFEADGTGFYISDLVVKKDYRGNGISPYLIQLAVNNLNPKLPYIFLMTLDEHINFYVNELGGECLHVKKPELGTKKLLFKQTEPGKLVNDFNRDVLEVYFNKSDFQQKLIKEKYNFAAYAKFSFSPGNALLPQNNASSKEKETKELGFQQIEKIEEESEANKQQHPTLHI